MPYASPEAIEQAKVPKKTGAKPIVQRFCTCFLVSLKRRISIAPAPVLTDFVKDIICRLTLSPDKRAYRS